MSHEPMPAFQEPNPSPPCARLLATVKRRKGGEVLVTSEVSKRGNPCLKIRMFYRAFDGLTMAPGSYMAIHPDDLAGLIKALQEAAAVLDQAPGDPAEFITRRARVPGIHQERP